MDLLSLKIIVLTLSGMVRLIFGMMPMLVMKCLTTKFKDSKLKTIIGFLMFFGGGVLLATCFLHMMPEVRESFKTALPTTEFPLAEIIFLGGFFIVYILEDVIHSVIDRRRSSKAKKTKSQKSKSITNGNGNGKKLTEEISNDKIFQANINGAYQSNGDITGKGMSINNPFPMARTTDINIVHAYHGEMIPTGGINVLPRIRSTNPNQNSNSNDYMMNHINNMVKNNPMEHHHNGLYGAEKFSYVDPDWWRDTVIANSQMNLLSTSSFSVAGVGGVGVGSGGSDPELGAKHQHQHHHLPENQFHQLTRHRDGSTTPEGSQSASGSGSASDLDVASTSSGSGQHYHQHNNHSHGHSHSHSHGHSHSHFPITDETTVSGSIRGIVIIIAISFHGIFEGLAIGLQSTPKDVWYLFLAVSLHECTILFCIGVELISSKTKPLRMIMYILVVSLVSPIGTAIGILISEESFRDEVIRALVIGSFQGLAAGTLLYVCFFEIFAEEGRNLKTKSLHIIVAIIGFALMACLELLGGHSHGGHSHGSPSLQLQGSNNTSTILDGHEDHDHSHSHPGYHQHEEDDHSHHDHDHSH